MGSYKAKHRLRKKPTSYLTYKWNGSLEKCESPRVHRRPVCLSQATLPDSFKLS